MKQVFSLGSVMVVFLTIAACGSSVDLTNHDDDLFDQSAENHLSEPGLKAMLSELSYSAEYSGAKNIDTNLVYEEAIYKKIKVISELWTTAADYGINDDTLITLDLASHDPDPRISDLAQRALQDLYSIQELEAKPSQMYPGPDVVEMGSGFSEHTESPSIEYSEYERIDHIPNLQGLEYDAIWGRENDVRISAIQNLALYRHNRVSNVLMDATRDPEVVVRHHAVRLLWLAAVDEGDFNSDAIKALEHACNDSDPYVASLAQTALDDIQGIVVAD